MVESKSAEELALEMFLNEARNTRAFLRATHKAAVAGDDLLASEWANSARLHRRNVSTLARIIRAIRAEKVETDTNPQTRDEMTNRDKIIRINDIAVRCITGPISFESGIDAIREIVNGVTLDEPREVPAEVEFDAEEITRIADAAIDAMAKRQPKAVPLPLITRNEELELRVFPRDEAHRAHRQRRLPARRAGSSACPSQRGREERSSVSAPNRIVIRRCPCHGITAICFEGQGGRRYRITPNQHCDQWEMRQGWILRAHEWRKVESLAREAAEALEKDAPKADAHDLALEKGWWDGYERDDQGRLILSTDQVISKIALIHAELSEAVEEARKSNDYGMYLGQGGKPEGFVVELADAVIRTLDLCGALGLDLEAAIVTKHEFNKTRPRRHGGKLA